jgi:hypothetical protein
MPTEDDFKDAYKDGKAAYRDGLALSDNPYKPAYCALGRQWSWAWQSTKDYDTIVEKEDK